MNATIQAAYVQVCAEIAKLEGVKRALEAAGASVGVKGRAEAQDASKAKGKAPTGHLRNAILSVLSSKAPKSNAQIRSELQAQGYTYSLSPLHVTKTLIALRKAKKVRMTGKGPKVSYRL